MAATVPAAGYNGKNWCFTLHNPEGEIDFNLWPVIPVFAVYQAEIAPETGTPHLQGYVHFAAKRRLTQVRAYLPTAHWEGCHGSPQQNYDYCTKAESRFPGSNPVIFGAFDAISTQGKAASVQEAISWITNDAEATIGGFMDGFGTVWARYPDLISRVRSARFGPRRGNRRVLVTLLFGRTGVGKSAFIVDNYPNAYWRPSGKWWPEYSGQEVVVFDDFNGSWFGCEEFLRICDRYSYIGEIKNGSVNLSATKFIITSNIHPDRWYSYHYQEEPAHLHAVRRRISQVITFSDDPEPIWFVQDGSEFFRDLKPVNRVHPSMFPVRAPEEPWVPMIQSESLDHVPEEPAVPATPVLQNDEELYEWQPLPASPDLFEEDPE